MNNGCEELSLLAADSQQSTGKDYPQAPGWTKRVHIGRAPVERPPCVVVYIVHILAEGEELSCECDNFKHTGLLCCHSVKVLDFLGIDKIPSKHILKGWTKDARDILPNHLAHLQRDKISANSITFRHSNLYAHALVVVKLGDANPIAYDCAMELLREAMDKLSPLAAEHDGLGLEHII
ncbi:hypothetical protein VPH35_108737 [Triticum aestivum]